MLLFNLITYYIIHKIELQQRADYQPAVLCLFKAKYTGNDL